MKRLLCLVLAGLGLLPLCACGRQGTGEGLTNMNIPAGDVTEFYYTYENINYGAFYQRYHFRAEDGKIIFRHETRERPHGYGPTTEQDVTASGTAELTEAQWAEVLALLKDGSVSRRTDGADSGSAGPWTYIYWKGDRDLYRKYEFPGYAEMRAFEDYCAALAG
ncbi:MAG: hypothetical protein IJ705_06570 [Oscillospiraceae bacterium]|nr:hypothetical protein [Oscillospiraceae bacterium]